MILLATKMLGDIAISATIEETYSDEILITEHPVEKGAPVNDHAYQKPREVVIKCGWSNADYSALLGSSVKQFVGDGSSSMTSGSYIDGIYSQLLKLQSDRQPFDIVTSRRKYSNMLLQSLSVVTDVKTAGALMVTATCKQVIIVETQVTTLPPRENQADPAATAETQDAGVKAATPATPAPGGAAPPEIWV
ncbi:phage baseplate protein [Burkholderia cenocepacia]|uniref:phage baseplate protein n=1 Tax=Burkholderia cenocepacia TaxID=95486 RepID=UPI0022320B70|nr:hypothetical protein [Burkholderia cenocepacia]MCW3543122.1 hypothetical protein [Burkholderia cenocepacia]